MATVRTKEKYHISEDQNSDSDTSSRAVPPLGAPVEQKRFWFQRDKNYDPDAIATQVLPHHFQESLVCRAETLTIVM